MTDSSPLRRFEECIVIADSGRVGRKHAATVVDA